MRFQIGEPWWWVTRATGAICLYDDGGAWRRFAPVPIADVRGALDAAQQATLDAAGAVLAQSTAALARRCGRWRRTPNCCCSFICRRCWRAAEVARANLPAGWAAPAFDVLQLEDYEWVTSGRDRRQRSGRGGGGRAARLSRRGAALFRRLRAEADGRQAQWRPIAARPRRRAARGGRRRCSSGRCRRCCATASYLFRSGGGGGGRIR